MKEKERRERTKDRTKTCHAYIKSKENLCTDLILVLIDTQETNQAIHSLSSRLDSVMNQMPASKYSQLSQIEIYMLFKNRKRRQKNKNLCAEL